MIIIMIWMMNFIKSCPRAPPCLAEIGLVLNSPVSGRDLALCRARNTCPKDPSPRNSSLLKPNRTLEIDILRPIEGPTEIRFSAAAPYLKEFETFIACGVTKELRNCLPQVFETIFLFLSIIFCVIWCDKINISF